MAQERRGAGLRHGRFGGSGRRRLHAERRQDTGDVCIGRDLVAGDADEVLVDLSRTAALPLGVLRVLAAAHRRLRGDVGSFVIVDPSPAAARALRVSGLDRVLVVLSAPAPAAADEAVS